MIALSIPHPLMLGAAIIAVDYTESDEILGAARSIVIILSLSPLFVRLAVLQAPITVPDQPAPEDRARLGCFRGSLPVCRH